MAADSIPFVLLDSTGSPAEGLSPAAFTLEAYSFAGVSRTPPELVELTGGAYALKPTEEDENVGTVVLVTCPAGSEPARVCVCIYRADRSNQAWAFHLEDDDGALWTGAAPTVDGYETADGEERNAPELRALAGAYLWFAKPSPADVAADVTAIFAIPAGATAAPVILGYVERPGSPPGGLADSYTPRRTGGLIRGGAGVVKRRTP